MRIQKDAHLYLIEPEEQFWMLYGDFHFETRPILAEIKTNMGGLKVSFAPIEVHLNAGADCCEEEKPAFFENCIKDKLKEELSKVDCTVAEYEVCR